MVNQADAQATILPYLRDQDIARFFLYRQDVVATALSYYRAKVSGVYHSDRTHRRRNGLDVTVDESEFERILEKCRADRQQLLRLHSVFGGHLYAYEDMADDWNAFIAKMGMALGLPGLHVERSLSKLGADGNAIHISNELQLRRRFPG